MKVLIVSLQKRGGGAIDALGMSNGLCANGFHHTMLISLGNELTGEFTENEFRHVVRVPTYGTTMASFLGKTLALSRPLGLVREIKRIRPDIVHITHFQPWSLFIFWMKPFLRFRIAYAVHENPYTRKDVKNPWIMGFLERRFIHSADVVLAYSDFIKHQLARHIPETKIRVSYLGAYDTFCPGFKAAPVDPASDLKLLFFGRIKPFKGVDVLVHAMEICKKKGVKAHLTIAGEGGAEGGLVDENKVNEAGVTWMNGFVSDEEACRLLSAADALVVPYKEATQTSPGALALGCKMPVIATAVGGLSEQVVHGVNGLLARPNDAKDLAHAIEKLAKDKRLVAEFREGARRLYDEKFGWKVVAKKLTEEIYSSLYADAHR